MSIWMIRRSARSFVLLLAAAAGAAVVALPITELVRTLQNVQPVQATVPPVSAVVWGDRVFSTPKPLAGWLQTRGVAYRAWAHRHPPANRLLQHEARTRAR
jgi:hypothetical protein